jgi:hypothetical protein
VQGEGDLPNLQNYDMGGRIEGGAHSLNILKLRDHLARMSSTNRRLEDYRKGSKLSGLNNSVKLKSKQHSRGSDKAFKRGNRSNSDAFHINVSKLDRNFTTKSHKQEEARLRKLKQNQLKTAYLNNSQLEMKKTKNRKSVKIRHTYNAKESHNFPEL